MNTRKRITHRAMAQIRAQCKVWSNWGYSRIPTLSGLVEHATTTVVESLSSAIRFISPTGLKIYSVRASQSMQGSNENPHPKFDCYCPDCYIRIEKSS